MLTLKHFLIEQNQEELVLKAICSSRNHLRVGKKPNPKREKSIEAKQNNNNNLPGFLYLFKIYLPLHIYNFKKKKKKDQWA